MRCEECSAAHDGDVFLCNDVKFGALIMCHTAYHNKHHNKQDGCAHYGLHNVADVTSIVASSNLVTSYMKCSSAVRALNASIFRNLTKVFDSGRGRKIRSDAKGIVASAAGRQRNHVIACLGKLRMK